jgi:glycosyltransferase involved in cell wall biosynthesis
VRFLVVYNGRIHPDSGAGGTVWQTNRALVELGHDVDVVSESEIRRTIGHHNLHYAFELPRRMLDAVRERMTARSFDTLLISQPYGYGVGRWLRRQPDWQRSAPVYLHRSHGHELAVTAQVEALRGGMTPETRHAWRRAATRVLGKRLAHQARQALRYADGTIVPSSFDRDFLVEREGANPERVRAIFHAAIPEYLSAPPAAYTADRHRRLLYVGNFTAVKGAGVLPAAVTAILTSFPDVQLTLVSPKHDHERLRAAFPDAVRSRVCIRDWVDQQALMDIYDTHGVQIVPSLYEGAAKAHYEGMSRGLCVIGSAVGAMRDSIRSGTNGLLAPPGDVAGLVDAMTFALGDCARAAGMATEASRTSREYTWRRTASEIVEFAHLAKERRLGG